MTQPFASFSITPSYSRGFYYSWDVAGDFNDAGPWDFTIQEGLAPDGPWTAISPVMSNVFHWKEGKRDPVNKSNVLYFRVILNTPDGSYKSQAIQPYGVLSRRDFLVAREIMRQSVLHSKGMAGIESNVYLLSNTGPKCQHCLDPITGMIRDSHCKYCLGTGRDPAYNGPYDVWANFSEDNQHQVAVEKTGTVEKKPFQVQIIGNPVIKHGDAIIIPSTDKRYLVDAAEVTSGMRGIPIIQTLLVEEAPQTDKIYDL